MNTQEYYANTGALKKAAETAGVKQGKAGKKVKVSIIESFAKVGRRCIGRGVIPVECSHGPSHLATSHEIHHTVSYQRQEVEAKDLEATLRMEYRSKLLNPKWAQAMAAQGAFWDGDVDVGCL